MFPKKSEWKGWSTIEKASYLAQILAPFSLLVTVLFSYLAWKEATYSFELQVTLFQAQNAPNLEVESVRIAQPGNAALMLVPVSNTGDSVARNICVNLYKIGSQKPFNSSCEPGRPFVGMSLQKSQGTNLPLESIVNLKNIFGFSPSKIHILKVGDDSISCSSASFGLLLLGLQYMDALNNEYGKLYTLLLCEQD